MAKNTKIRRGKVGFTRFILIASTICLGLLLFTYLAAAQNNGTLHPVSNAEELRAALASAQSGDTILLENDIYLEETLEIPAALDGGSLAFAASPPGSTLYAAPGHRHLSTSYNCTLTFTHVVLNGENQAGGIEAWAPESFTLRGAVLQGCVSNDVNWGGGAVFAFTSNVTIESCIFTGNSARMGGAITALGMDALLVTDCDFNGNTAEAEGGAIYSLMYNEVEVAQSGFAHNTAGTDGGALLIGATESLLVASTSFEDNRATGLGGAIALDDANATVQGCGFNGNSAQAGGAIYAPSYRALHVQASSFAANQAAEGPQAFEGGAESDHAETHAKQVEGLLSLSQPFDPDSEDERLNKLYNNLDVQYSGQGFYTVSLYASPQPAEDENAALAYVVQQDSYTLPTAVQAGLALEGHYLAGWTLETGEGHTLYIPGDAVTPVGDISLYPVWKPNRYTVTYSPGPGEGSEIRYEHLYASEHVVATEALLEYSYEGHRFAGWESGGARLTPGASFTVLENVTLTALWRKLPESSSSQPSTTSSTPTTTTTTTTTTSSSSTPPTTSPAPTTTTTTSTSFPSTSTPATTTSSSPSTTTTSSSTTTTSTPPATSGSTPTTTSPTSTPSTSASATTSHTSTTSAPPSTTTTTTTSVPESSSIVPSSTPSKPQTSEPSTSEETQTSSESSSGSSSVSDAGIPTTSGTGSSASQPVSEASTEKPTTSRAGTSSASVSGGQASSSIAPTTTHVPEPAPEPATPAEESNTPTSPAGGRTNTPATTSPATSPPSSLAAGDFSPSYPNSPDIAPAVLSSPTQEQKPDTPIPTAQNPVGNVPAVVAAIALCASLTFGGGYLLGRRGRSRK